MHLSSALDTGASLDLERAVRERLMSRPPLCPSVANVNAPAMLESFASKFAIANGSAEPLNMKLGMLAAARSDVLLQRRGEELQRLVSSLASEPEGAHSADMVERSLKNFRSRSSYGFASLGPAYGSLKDPLASSREHTLGSIGSLRGLRNLSSDSDLCSMLTVSPALSPPPAVPDSPDNRCPPLNLPPPTTSLTPSHSVCEAFSEHRRLSASTTNPTVPVATAGAAKDGSASAAAEKESVESSAHGLLLLSAAADALGNAKRTATHTITPPPKRARVR